MVQNYEVRRQKPSSSLAVATGSKVPIKWLILWSHSEAMAVLTCPKPISKAHLVPRPKHNTAFVGFTLVNNQGERNTSKEILKSVRVEELNKISTDETTKLIKSLPNLLRNWNSLKSINF
ncbi:hypothetical protein TNCV_4535631 [Trichonephila clavipes]|nr:hypothetical protein TNCV_4535631 [Trichonephila clavipes]